MKIQLKKATPIPETVLSDHLLPILKKPKPLPVRCAFVVLLLFFICRVATAQAEPYRVAVVPFQVHSEKNLSFLIDSIHDMLSSRLAWEDRVMILDRTRTEASAQATAGPWTEASVRAFVHGLDADFVLHGNLFIAGDRINVDAQMVDVSGNRRTVSFGADARKMGDVMAKINGFATEINRRVFARNTPLLPP
jgi:TolB-like protein